MDSVDAIRVVTTSSREIAPPAERLREIAQQANDEIQDLYFDYIDVYAENTAYTLEALIDAAISLAAPRVFWAAPVGQWLTKVVPPDIKEEVLEKVLGIFIAYVDDRAGINPGHERIKQFILEHIIYQEDIADFESVKREYRARLNEIYLQFESDLQKMDDDGAIPPEHLNKAIDHFDKMIKKQLGLWRQHINFQADVLSKSASLIGNLDNTITNQIEITQENISTCYTTASTPSEEFRCTITDVIGKTLNFGQTFPLVIAKQCVTWGVAVEGIMLTDLRNLDVMDDEFEFYYLSEVETIKYILETGMNPVLDVKITDARLIQNAKKHLQINVTIQNDSSVPIVVRVFYKVKPPKGTWALGKIYDWQTLEAPILLEANSSHTLPAFEIWVPDIGTYKVTIEVLYGIGGLEADLVRPFYGNTNERLQKTIELICEDKSESICRLSHSAVLLSQGDVNQDGNVSIFDIVEVASQFGQRRENLSGDVNGDGTVNIFDLVEVASHFGEEAQ